MALRNTVIASALLGTLLGACVNPPGFRCGPNASCNASTPASETCVQGYCAVADPTCGPGGYRYTSSAAQPDACVTVYIDASTDASTDASIDTVGDVLVDATTTDHCVPSGAEICDGIDNNCNGTVDEGCPIPAAPVVVGRAGTPRIVGATTTVIHMSCPSGSALVGVRPRPPMAPIPMCSLPALSPICVPIIVGQTATMPTYTYNLEWSGLPTPLTSYLNGNCQPPVAPAADVMCSTNALVVGIALASPSGTGTIPAFQLDCATASITTSATAPPTVNFHAATMLAIIGYTGTPCGNTFNSESCVPGEAAVELDADGAYCPIDGFGFACTGFTIPTIPLHADP